MCAGKDLSRTKNPQTDDHQVLVTYSGKHQVRYRCPCCQEILRSALKNAGQTECCPSCSRNLLVPGRDKLLELKDEIDLPRVSRLKAIQLKNASMMEQTQHQLLKEIEKANTEKRVRLKELNKQLETQFADSIRRLQLGKKNWKEELLLRVSAACADKINRVCESQLPDRLQSELVTSILKIRKDATTRIITGDS